MITGPPRWNALGLGSTAMFAATLAYNTRRSGDFTFDGRRFLLRRVLFPDDPPPEWFVIDLLQHHEMAGQYGTKAALALIERCIVEAGLAS